MILQILFCFAVSFCLLSPAHCIRINEEGAVVMQGCFSQCSEPSQVPCGEPITTNCYKEGVIAQSFCEGIGTGLNFKQCLRNSLLLFQEPKLCGKDVTDDCGNSCGVKNDDVQCVSSSFESCEIAVTHFGEGFYRIKGTRLYCDADGYALFARIPGGQSTFFYPGLSLNEAQLPSNESTATLSQISLTPSNSPSGDEVVYGHVNMSVAQSIQSTRFKCRLSATAEFTTYETTVLTGWTPADYPAYNAPGGWAIVGIPPHCRGSHYLCGHKLITSGMEGIGLCDGPGSSGSYANHRATFNYDSITTITCAQAGSNSPEAEFQLWVKF